MLAARMMDLFAANYMDSVPTMQDDEGFLDDASLGDALLHVLSTGRDDEGGKCFDTTAPCSDSDLEKQCTDCELFLDDLETTISDYIDATLDLTIGAKWDESSFDAWETILDASVHGSTSEHPKEPVASETLSGPYRPSEAELKSCCNDRAKKDLLTWYTRLNEFDQLMTKNNVGQKTRLGRWINKNRMEKKKMDEGRKTAMTRKRVELLEECGFLWAEPKDVFDKNFAILSGFRKIVGHSDFPTGKNRYTDEKIEKTVQKLLRGRRVSQMEMQRLRFILKNPKMSRWITTLRDEWKKRHDWDDNSNVSTVKKRGKYDILLARMRKLQEIDFNFQINHRRRD